MWDKRGLIYTTPGSHEWNKTHAQVPVVDVLDDKLRIYFATRNAEGKSNISFIETTLCCRSVSRELSMIRG